VRRDPKDATAWHALGLVYRDRLQQTAEAIEAFKMSSALKPDVLIEHQILAELYEATEQWDDAIVEQRLLLEHDPLNVEAYRGLYRLYLQKHAYDEAWCLAAAMSFFLNLSAAWRASFADSRFISRAR
jgi:tetratricopeptide (TPR) repeat protein